VPARDRLSLAAALVIGATGKLRQSAADRTLGDEEMLGASASAARSANIFGAPLLTGLRRHHPCTDFGAIRDERRRF